jgi:hypothetical protein
MADLHLRLDYDVIKDIFCFQTDIKTEALSDLVGEFLHSQFGAGIDDRPREEHELYEIDMDVDLSDDTFRTRHNCGNLGLRDGILMHFLSKLKG